MAQLKTRRRTFKVFYAPYKLSVFKPLRPKTRQFPQGDETLIETFFFFFSLYMGGVVEGGLVTHIQGFYFLPTGLRLDLESRDGA